MKKVLLVAMVGIISLSASAQSLKGHIEGGYTFGDHDGGRLEFLGALGGKVNKHFFLGGGVGLNYYTTADICTLPIFANARVKIPVSGNIRPFFDLKPGYGVSLDSDINGGFYFNGTFGIEFSKVTVGIGYGTQTFKVSDGFHTSAIGSNGGLSLKLGYEF